MDNSTVKATDDIPTTSLHISGSKSSSTTTPKELEIETTTPEQSTKLKSEVSVSPVDVTTAISTVVSTITTTTEKLNKYTSKSDYGRPHSTRRPDQISSETSEMVALIIGIIAGALIAVILIMLIILRFKSRTHHSFKIDDSKGFQQGPNAALLGNSSGTNRQSQYQLNGALRNGDKSQIQKKKRDSKDIKEWYV